MSDRFRTLGIEQLTSWIADELEAKDSVFGIPCKLGFFPSADDPFRTEVFGHALETPLGVAAGPHSQLAQNIVVAWLCGARFIELKTVQTLDNLEISKPCIDMQDAGYNVEWSQELGIEESFHEYLHAWVLIHALHRRFGFPGDTPGVIFNLSVGYDLDGIRQPNMQRYLDRIEDCPGEVQRCADAVAQRFPEVSDIDIPSRLSDNVTLSTMHGCPPEEIGAISEYLLTERGLHTSVKLNPTLLGAERLRGILNDTLGYTAIEVPDEAFAHDLVFEDALSLVKHLRDTARPLDLEFGVKLTNTLEVRNHRRVFNPADETMYLSGRPLHGLTVNLAYILNMALDDPILMSFSGGADAANTPALLQCGMSTVTVCSDLLKPGGYLRLRQYLEVLDGSMAAAGAFSLEEFIRAGSPDSATLAGAAARNLELYAKAAISDTAYHAGSFQREHTKTPRPLGLFDCIKAPCTDICDVDQKVPEYMRRVRDGDLVGAASITRSDNPLASILGRTCHHPCEPVCLRTHMDQPLAIREIKRFITDHEQAAEDDHAHHFRGPAVAVVGGGPCGLTAATYLARAGLPVTVIEARPAGGGMVSATIPDYRAAHHAVERDLERVRRLGVDFRYNQNVGDTVTLASLREEGFETIVVAIGARKGRPLDLSGEDGQGIFDGLDFLRAARMEEKIQLGPRIGIVGGGDVAMDCARTARRLSDGDVTVFYRRTVDEMPAHEEELRDLLDEGGRLVELATPKRLVLSNGKLEAVSMSRMKLGEPDDSGRRRPETVPGAEFEVELDTLIIAIGQLPDLGVFAGENDALSRSGFLVVDPKTLQTSLPGVYAGGDIIGDGPSNIVKAAGDGRRIARAIVSAAANHTDARPPDPLPWPVFDRVDFLRRRAVVEPRVAIPHLPPADRGGFDEVIQTLTPDDAAREASRCLDCDVMCSTCEGVCPNRAILTYTATPGILNLPRLEVRNERLTQVGSFEHGVAQGPQVAVLTDACNECGNCVTFCPTAGRPWHDKPRLYFHRADFEAEDDNAFMLLSHGDIRGIQARFCGALHELFADDRWRYTSPNLSLELDLGTLEVFAAHRVGSGTFDADRESEHLGTMIALDRALTNSMPELPVVEAKASWLLDPTFVR